MTEQFTDVLTVPLPPAIGREMGVVRKHKQPASETNTGAGTLSLEQLKERFIKFGRCDCPKHVIVSVRPYNADYTEDQCQVCQNVFGRNYD